MKGTNSMSLVVTCVAMVILIPVVTSSGIGRFWHRPNAHCPVYQGCDCTCTRNDPGTGICGPEGREIDCHGWGFHVMPALQPGNYTHIRLHVHYNFIRTIQDGNLLIPSLKTLHLDHNNLTRVPADVSHLPHLEYLSLHVNNIEVIDDVTYPNTLEEINAEWNNIKTITLIKFNGNDPSNNKLLYLQLGINPLTSIAADAFKYLKNLELLTLDNTRLTRLPLALADLAHLRSLYIHEVPDLQCTCEESSLHTWYDHRRSDKRFWVKTINGKCSKIRVWEFLERVAKKCPAS